MKLFSSPSQQIRFLQKLQKSLERVIRYGSFLAFLVLLRHIGYSEDPGERLVESVIFSSLILLIGFTSLVKIGFFEKSIQSSRIITEVLLSLFLIFSAIYRFGFFPSSFDSNLQWLESYYLVNLSIIVLFFIELSKLSMAVNRLRLSPSLVFILSFLMVICIGAALLSLPAATTRDISVIDAFFTSVSAVCVTGLIVLDTSSDFTFFGQTVIMSLFQIGGLGMMTFTSFFGFFFKGSYSLENSLFLRDYINENNVNEVYSTLLKIISFTLLVEGGIALMIYFNTPGSLFESISDRIFFSLFHSISAFCNAGFSTLRNGLFEAGFRELYTMQLGICIAIVLGGIGFPVVLNYYSYLKHLVVGGWKKLCGYEEFRHVARTTNLTTRLVMYTTGFLLILGAVVYYFAEKEHTLQGLSPYGQVVTTVFGTVTPRTAGFNTVDMTQLAMPTVLIYLVLMWIGGSPGSTAGGLKTSTFAVAVINTVSIASGKKRVEIFGREISQDSLQKAFAVIALSFLIIGLGVFLVTLFNPELALIDVAFEVFSAFSTVGLSLGITASLSTASKIVIMIIMFIGRVGSLTILVAVVRKAGSQKYAYPKETIIIT
ncbi:Trk-type K+ transport system, membrane component [Algoriphagus hitonicola]|uniref:Trk-type K+ transport system, membrane component n=1 Tax=Algoriphagus hitonicola TaxID=435880 RepID=A0A1I2QAU6_9BACT|nr:potassium transporter TrkG [Algoriphagus hitonicola]SFG25428.1 Trk-type K+ transport system, membrane component [Algoriphagus hitonicola]